MTGVLREGFLTEGSARKVLHGRCTKGSSRVVLRGKVFAAGLLLLSVVVAACGKRGDPIAPVPVISDADTGFGSALNVARTVVEMDRVRAIGGIESAAADSICANEAASVSLPGSFHAFLATTTAFIASSARASATALKPSASRSSRNSANVNVPPPLISRAAFSKPVMAAR